MSTDDTLPPFFAFTDDLRSGAIVRYVIRLKA